MMQSEGGSFSKAPWTDARILEDFRVLLESADETATELSLSLSELLTLVYIAAERRVDVQRIATLNAITVRPTIGLVDRLVSLGYVRHERRTATVTAAYATTRTGDVAVARLVASLRRGGRSATS